MELLEQMAMAALCRESLNLRSLVQDWLRSGACVESLPRPNTTDAKILAISAALAELLALRQGQTPPAWTQTVGPLIEPFFLIESVSSMKRLRVLCETQSPEPLRKRRLYAPPPLSGICISSLLRACLAFSESKKQDDLTVLFFCSPNLCPC